MAMAAIAHQFGGQWHSFARVREGDVQLWRPRGHVRTYAVVNPQGASAILKLIGIADGDRTYLLMISATKAEFERSRSALDQIEQSLHIDAPGGDHPVDQPRPQPSPAMAGSQPPVSQLPAPRAPSTPADRNVAAKVNATSAKYYRMKKVAVVDAHGFERPIQALSLLIPSDWQFQGSVQIQPEHGVPPRYCAPGVSRSESGRALRD